MDIRSKIKEQFPLQGAPSYRLSDAIVEDDYGDTSLTFEESWNTWAEIENWQIVKSDVFFSYAPKSAAIYLLPRFMIFVLDEIESKLEPQYLGNSAGDCAVWYIQTLKKKNYKNTKLTSLQIEVLENFLAYIYKDLDYRVTVDVGDEQP